MENLGKEAVYEVMTTRPAEIGSAFDEANQDFVFGEIWSRPGLSRRNRRWVTLTCVGAAVAPRAIDEQVYAALNSGDMTLDEMLEFVLHFAVYNGWPKASHLEGVVRRQWARIEKDRGLERSSVEPASNDTLGLNDWDARIERGVKEFMDVNLIDAPSPDTPYIHAGILNFVFGHVWQRPGLTRRDRRFVTVASVAVNDAVTPLQSHVGSALESGDITKSEMDEVVLQLSAYSGFAKGEALQTTADEAWDRLSLAGIALGGVRHESA